ncbi:MAG: hypothetical protein LBN39_05055, partial [Planctomycetaceae bacterium]|nr:hypothetical protein [Planctomycetaceae bacterium]
MNKEQHRTLQLETLENREMLSINPLVPLDADISFNAPVIQAAVPQDANAADVAAMNALINK